MKFRGGAPVGLFLFTRWPGLCSVDPMLSAAADTYLFHYICFPAVSLLSFCCFRMFFFSFQSLGAVDEPDVDPRYVQTRRHKPAPFSVTKQSAIHAGTVGSG